jgi:enterochelin esterase family protein
LRQRSLLRATQRFYGNVLSQSGAYGWSPDDADEGEALARDYATRPRLPLRFWVEAQQQSARREPPYAHVLIARGYEVSYGEFAGGHDPFN